MHHVIPKARWHENLRFLLGHFLPYHLSGIFIRCRFFGWVFARLRIHPFHPGFFARLRKRHAGDRVLMRLSGRPVLPRPVIDRDGPVPLINNHFEIRFQAARRDA